MAGTIRSDKRGPHPHLTLNSDGHPHPVLNAASFFTLIIGILSFSLGLYIRTAPDSAKGIITLTAATGLAAVLVGLYTQVVSATREERMVIIPGIVAGFVGLALGLAFGGFSG